MKKQTLSLLSAVAVASLLGTSGASVAADRVVKIAGFGAKSGVVRSFGINTEAVMQAAVEHINGAGRGQTRRRHHGPDRDVLRRRPLQRRGRHLRPSQDRELGRPRRGRADLLERGRAPVRHPSAQRGRRGRLRPPDPGLHRHRHQGRTREDLRVGIPQRAQRERDVPHPVPLGEGELSGPRVDVRRGGGRLRPLALHLVRGDGQAGARKPGSKSRASPSGCSRTRTSPSRCAR